VEEWNVKNPIWYPSVEVWNRFASEWMMPLILVISGASLFYAVGKGSIDWVKTFTAAKTGGVKNYFVEQNWELTQQSVAYLKTLTV
jgi:sugar phosphate isomerase/epimerase